MSASQKWQCMVCGYVEEGASPPDECPVCGAPWAAFDRLSLEEVEFRPAVAMPRADGFRYVIIGNSSAGRSAAQAIRQLDAQARVTLLSEESVPFHYRPVLPDLIGGMSQAQVFASARGVYSDEGLEIRLGETVEAIATDERLVRCKSGEAVPYDGLLIASGSTPVVVPWPNGDAAGIAYFRTFTDAQAIPDLCGSARRAGGVGGGLLGLEFVRAFLARGLAVTVLVRDDRVGAPGLDPEAGAIVARRLEELGVQVGLQEEVAAFEVEGGRVAGVRTSRERTLPCEVVGVAVGARPRIDFVKGSDIRCDRGIVVDARFETSVPGVFAAGDVAQAFDLAHGAARVNTSWRMAREQGQVAGWNLAGADVRSPGVVGSNFQVFGGVAFASIGAANSQDPACRVEKEFDSAAGTYQKRVFIGDRLVGAVLVGDTSAAREIEMQIRGVAPAPRPTQAPETRRRDSMRKMTEENLKAAFAGESQAHMKYLNFAEKARREGKANVARLFAAASFAEQVHASAHFRVLKGVGSTSDNLAAAAEGENFEAEEMYPAYIAVAEAQDEKGAKNSFYRALEAEKVHRSLYLQAKEAVDAGKDADLGAVYVCKVCGFTTDGACPDDCPLCGASSDQFAQF